MVSGLGFRGLTFVPHIKAHCEGLGHLHEWPPQAPLIPWQPSYDFGILHTKNGFILSYCRFQTGFCEVILGARPWRSMGNYK